MLCLKGPKLDLYYRESLQIWKQFRPKNVPTKRRKRDPVYLFGEREIRERRVDETLAMRALQPPPEVDDQPRHGPAHLSKFPQGGSLARCMCDACCP